VFLLIPGDRRRQPDNRSTAKQANWTNPAMSGAVMPLNRYRSDCSLALVSVDSASEAAIRFS
jgi:hypothetical protein